MNVLNKGQPDVSVASKEGEGGRPCGPEQGLGPGLLSGSRSYGRVLGRKGPTLTSTAPAALPSLPTGMKRHSWPTAGCWAIPSPAWLLLATL